MLKASYHRLVRFSDTIGVLWLDRSMFEAMNALAQKGQARVLNLGSGRGLFDPYLKCRTINLDISPQGGPHVVGDAHHLPVRDEALDGVFCNAVLEHVRQPWAVAAEMRRVLKPGGLVCVNVPFLGSRHGVHDYFRFTHEGLRSLFDGFKEVKSGISAGPGSFITVFASQYVLSFVPEAMGRARALLALAVRLLLCPLKYVDLLRKRDKICDIANSFYYVCVKE